MPNSKNRRLFCSALALGAARLLGGCGRPPIAHAEGTPAPAAPAADPVERVRVPEGGIQPQAVIDARGVIHLVYLKGEPGAADIFYTRREGAAWSPAIRVNGRPKAAVAAGTIRGPQLALGKNGRVHVVWFGSAQSGIKGPGDSAPLLYSRLKDDGSAFEPERNLMQVSTLLDGGASVAADRAGNVYVAWQAGNGSSKSEEARCLWISRSGDEGRTFSREVPAWSEPLGACPCCSTKAFVDAKGTLYVLYRMAINRTDRDMVLVCSTDRGKTFQGRRIDPWAIDACPMSSEDFVESPDGILCAWETEKQVKFARITPGSATLSTPVAPSGPLDNRKHPVLAVSRDGETLLAWTEGTGWNRGGTLAWQRYDRSGRPIGERGRVTGGIPVWGLVATVARPEGGFLLIH